MLFVNRCAGKLQKTMVDLTITRRTALGVQALGMSSIRLQEVGHLQLASLSPHDGEECEYVSVTFILYILGNQNFSRENNTQAQRLPTCLCEGIYFHAQILIDCVHAEAHVLSSKETKVFAGYGRWQRTEPEPPAPEQTSQPCTIFDLASSCVVGSPDRPCIPSFRLPS